MSNILHTITDIGIAIGTVAGSVSALATALSHWTALPEKTRMLLSAVGVHTKRIGAALKKERDHACPYCLGTGVNPNPDDEPTPPRAA